MQVDQGQRAGNQDEDQPVQTANPEVKMISVKLSQGVRPGLGGLLPGAKVTPEIAAIRGIPVGEDSISPNGHSEIANVGELLDFIAHVREVNGLPVGFKAALGGIDWIRDLCIEVHKRGLSNAPDFIIIDGSEGGTSIATGADGRHGAAVAWSVVDAGRHADRAGPARTSG